MLVDGSSTSSARTSKAVTRATSPGSSSRSCRLCPSLMRKLRPKVSPRAPRKCTTFPSKTAEEPGARPPIFGRVESPNSSTLGDRQAVTATAALSKQLTDRNQLMTGLPQATDDGRQRVQGPMLSLVKQHDFTGSERPCGGDAGDLLGVTALPITRVGRPEHGRKACARTGKQRRRRECAVGRP